MRADELREKAKQLLEQAKETEKRDRERAMTMFGKILLKHYENGFKDCTIEKLKTECKEAVNPDSKKSKSEAKSKSKSVEDNSVKVE